MLISAGNLLWLTEPHDGHAAPRTDARSAAIPVEYAIKSRIGVPLLRYARLPGVDRIFERRCVRSVRKLGIPLVA
jgi:hypothetical protein